MKNALHCIVYQCHQVIEIFQFHHNPKGLLLYIQSAIDQDIIMTFLEGLGVLSLEKRRREVVTPAFKYYQVLGRDAHSMTRPENASCCDSFAVSPSQAPSTTTSIFLAFSVNRSFPWPEHSDSTQGNYRSPSVASFCRYSLSIHRALSQVLGQQIM